MSSFETSFLFTHLQIIYFKIILLLSAIKKSGFYYLSSNFFPAIEAGLDFDQIVVLHRKSTLFIYKFNCQFAEIVMKLLLKYLQWYTQEKLHRDQYCGSLELTP